MEKIIQLVILRQFSALTIPDLSEAIQQWETSANRQLVTWIGHSQCWTDEIPSAVAFLCGAFPHAQPPGFNPIIISDTSSGTLCEEFYLLK